MPIIRKTSKAEEIEKKMALKQKKKSSKQDTSEEETSEEESPVPKKKASVVSKKKKELSSDEENITSDVELDSSVIEKKEEPVINDIEKLISENLNGKTIKEVNASKIKDATVNEILLSLMFRSKETQNPALYGSLEKIFNALNGKQFYGHSLKTGDGNKPYFKNNNGKNFNNDNREFSSRGRGYGRGQDRSNDRGRGGNRNRERGGNNGDYQKTYGEQPIHQHSTGGNLWENANFTN